jgi:hypothetical protein
MQDKGMEIKTFNIQNDFHSARSLTLLYQAGHITDID